MAECMAAVRTALDLTLEAKTARITYSTEQSWALPQFPARGNRGPVARAARGVVTTGAKAIGRGIIRWVADPRHRVGDGVLDLVGRRSMIGYGSYAVLQVGTKEWSGRSGRAVSTLPATPAGAASPLWLLDLVAGVTSADDSGGDQVEGQNYRHIVATASLAEAAARQPEAMPSPAQNRFEDLLHLPVELWLDDQRLRRIRFVSEHRTDTLSLDEFGVDTEQLDWSRLPTFRSSPS